MSVYVQCSTCKVQERVDEIKAEESAMLGWHICGRCLAAFLDDIGLHGIAENVRMRNVALRTG